MTYQNSSYCNAQILFSKMDIQVIASVGTQTLLYNYLRNMEFQRKLHGHTKEINMEAS